MSGEIMQVPSVLLTERAFKSAQDEGIVTIQPNRDHMLAISQITDTGDVYVPDITILRQHNQTNWDMLYRNAPTDYRYTSSAQLGVHEHNLPYVSAGGLRDHMIRAEGKKILELTVRDWDALGAAFADAVEQSKTIGASNLEQIADYVAGGLGLVGRLFDVPKLMSPHEKRVRQVANLHPYIITRHQ